MIHLIEYKKGTLTHGCTLSETSRSLCVLWGGGRTPLIRSLRSVLAKTTRGEPDLPRAQEDMERVEQFGNDDNLYYVG